MDNWCQILTLVTFLAIGIGSLLSLVICGLLVSRPNFHGAKFENGACELTTLEMDMDEAPLIQCDCGGGDEETCVSYFPCITALGIFYKNSTDGYEEGTSGAFHYDYEASQAGCLYVPPCTPSYVSNEKLVELYWKKFYRVLGNSDYFICWGYEGAIYLWMEYSLTKAYMGVLIPTGLFLVAVCIGVGYFLKSW